MRSEYLKGLAIPLLFLCLTFALCDSVPAGEGVGLKLVGQVGGATYAVAVKGVYSYVGVGLRLVVLDVSKPEQPVEVGFTEPFSASPPRKFHSLPSRSIEGTTASSLESAEDYPEPSLPLVSDAEFFCQVTGTGDSGPGTFRACLENAVSGRAITFDPAVFIPQQPAAILLQTQLPAITQGALTIDASNAGVILDRRNTPGGTVGFIVDSSKNIIKGLQILNSAGEGMQITGRVSQNLIGGDRTAGEGPSAEGNVVSRNGLWSGLRVTGSNNIIQGNLIGADVTGNTAIGNKCHGVLVWNADFNRVGGSRKGEGNVISGNHRTGVDIC